MALLPSVDSQLCTSSREPLPPFPNTGPSQHSASTITMSLVCSVSVSSSESNSQLSSGILMWPCKWKLQPVLLLCSSSPSPGGILFQHPEDAQLFSQSLLLENPAIVIFKAKPHFFHIVHSQMDLASITGSPYLACLSGCISRIPRNVTYFLTT